MSFDVFRDDEGYTLFLSPPLIPSERVETGLSKRDLFRRLQSLNLDIRDEMEAVSSADEIHKRGWTAPLREVRFIRSRAAAGAATLEDSEFIRRQLADHSYPFRRTYLMDTLRMLGAVDDAVSLAAMQLSSNPQAEDNQLALELIAKHAPERYPGEAIALLNSRDTDLECRAWTLTYAGEVMARVPSPELAEELARIAGSSDEVEFVRYHAQRALAQAVGQLRDVRAVVAYQRRDADLPDLIGKVRLLTIRGPVGDGPAGDGQEP